MENNITNKSLKNKVEGYLLNEIKKSALALSILTLVLLAVNPGLDILAHLMGAYSDIYEMTKEEILYQKEEIFSVVSTVIACGMIIASFFAVFKLTFLHNKRKLDFYLSIPLSRAAVLMCNIVSALIMLLVPYTITHFIGTLYFIDVPGIWNSALEIWIKVIVIVFANIALGTFICVCCGRTIDAVLVYVLYNVSFISLFVLITEMVNNIIPGIEYRDDILTKWCVWGCPLALIATDEILPYVWWSALAIVLYIVSAILMKNRKSEVAQDRFAYKATEIIIEYVAEVLVGLFCGYIAAIICVSEGKQLIEIVWFIIGTAFGCFASHTAMHFIFTRSKKGYIKNLLRIIPPAATGMVTMLIIVSGCLGIDTYVPEEKEIEKITVERSNYSGQFIVNGKNILYKQSIDKSEQRSIIKYHQELVDEIIGWRNKHGIYTLKGYYQYITDDTASESDIDYAKESEPNIDYDTYYDTIKITYYLKNGKKVQRYYTPSEHNVEYPKEIGNIVREGYNITPQNMERIPYGYIESITYLKYADAKERINYYFNSNELTENKELFSKIIKTYNDEHNGDEEDGNILYEFEINLVDDRGMWDTCYISVFESDVNTIKLIEDSILENDKYFEVCDQVSTYNDFFDENNIGSMERTDDAVYVKLPENWLSNESVYAVPVTYYVEHDAYSKYEYYDVSVLMKPNEGLKCEKVETEDGILYKYMIPHEKYGFNEVIFYQNSGNDFRCTKSLEIENNIGKVAERDNYYTVDYSRYYEPEQFDWSDTK